MKVPFFFDPIGLEQLASSLQSEGVAVLITTRPNAKSIFGKVQPLLDGTVLHLAAEGHDRDWYHYLLFDVAEIELEDADALVKQAAQKWGDAGHPWEFVADV